jgi:hypothetical protein
MCSIHLIQYGRCKRILRLGPNPNNSAPPINTGERKPLTIGHPEFEGFEVIQTIETTRPPALWMTLGIAGRALERRWAVKSRHAKRLVPRSSDDCRCVRLPLQKAFVYKGVNVSQSDRG